MNMSENEQILVRLREHYTPKRRQTLHRELAILRLLTTYNPLRSMSIFKIHQELTDEKFKSEIGKIEELVGVGLGKKLHFVEVLRLVHNLEIEGLVDIRSGKRRAKLISPTFKGFLYCSAFGHLSRQESVDFLARYDRLMGALIKLYPESEHAKLTEVVNLILRSIFSNLYLFPMGLNISETDLQDSRDTLLYPVQLNTLVGVLAFMRREVIKPEDFNRLSKEEKEILKSAWNRYLNETKSYFEYYDLAKKVYDETIKLW